MKKKKNTKNVAKNKHIDLIALIISCVAIFVSLITFILPFSRTRLVIEEPTNVFVLKKQEKYDEIIIPLICSNYGNINRNIYDMECYLISNGNYVPMKPTYILEDVYQNVTHIEKTYYSSFYVGQNEVVEKKLFFHLMMKTFQNLN